MDKEQQIILVRDHSRAGRWAGRLLQRLRIDHDVRFVKGEEGVVVVKDGASHDLYEGYEGLRRFVRLRAQQSPSSNGSGPSPSSTKTQ
jgi:hypothetical protein